MVNAIPSELQTVFFAGGAYSKTDDPKLVLSSCMFADLAFIRTSVGIKK
jgi:hypothetical protein